MEWLYALLSVAIKAYCINCYKDSNSFILSQKGNWFSKTNIKILTKLFIEDIIYISYLSRNRGMIILVPFPQLNFLIADIVYVFYSFKEEEKY